MKKRSFTPEEKVSLQSLDDKLTDAYLLLKAVDPDAFRDYVKGEPTDPLHCAGCSLELARSAVGMVLTDSVLQGFTGPIN